MDTHEAPDRAEEFSHLLVAFPGDDPPLRDAVRGGILATGRYEEIAPPPPPAKEVRWVDGWRDVEGAEYVVWGTPYAPPRLIPPCSDPACRCHDGGVSQLGGWYVGIFTVFPRVRPLHAWRRQLRLAVDVFGVPHDVWDDASQMYLQAERVAGLVDPAVRPPPQAAYSVHAITREPGDATVWVHTHGLQRLGLPDLELFDWPSSEMGSALEALLRIVELGLARPFPPPARPFELGPGLRVAWIPLLDALPRLPAGTFGGAEDRGRSEGIHQRRAVLVTPQCAARGPLTSPLAAVRGWADIAIDPHGPAAAGVSTARRRWTRR